MGGKVGLYHIRSNGRALDLRRHGNGKWNPDPRNEGYLNCIVSSLWCYLMDNHYGFNLSIRALFSPFSETISVQKYTAETNS
ncbi:unnamed protein product [Citrullus colocynthis]|uniref:Uncharacterized protein n=1 Tax=Citrullus colocynthis TaxID=252529 RepID=A0ABP0XWC9_9ROSI